ncbi:MAG: hypothetical protein ACRDSL_02890 [Pseudonocardiaceae bacterium]
MVGVTGAINSTRETYLGYIERTIKPVLGSTSITKLSPCHLETLYAQLRRCGRTRTRQWPPPRSCRSTRSSAAHSRRRCGGSGWGTTLRDRAVAEVEAKARPAVA